MIVCVCKRVSDRDIRAAVAEGACRMRDLNQSLGVGSQCGRCCRYAKDVLDACQSSCNAANTPLVTEVA